MAKNETALIIRIREKQDKLAADQKKTLAMLRGHKAKMEGIGRQMSQTLSTYFGAFTVIQGITAATRSLAGFEFQMSKVRAVSGASEDQFRALQENALELGRASKYTATEIGQLQLELSKLGFSPEKILASTDAVRRLATVADSELGAAASTMAGTLNSFNLEATESIRVANVMAESFSKSALDLEKFTVATSNSGAIANVMGITLEENTARLGALVDANIDASKAGTDLRRIYLDLNTSGLTYNQAMQMIMDSSDQAGLAQELFGDRAAAAAVILAQQQEKVNNLTVALMDSNKELNKMSDIMEDNLLTAWDKFISAIDGAIQKGTAVREFFRTIVDGATFAVNALFGNLPSYEENIIEKFKKQGESIASGFDESAESLEDLNTTLSFYQDRLEDAERKLNVFTMANVQNGKVTASNASEYRDLRDEVLKYSNIIDPLKEKQDGISKSMEYQANAAKKAKEEIAALRQEQAYLAGAGLEAPDQVAINAIELPDAPGLTGMADLIDESLERAKFAASDGMAEINEILTGEMQALADQLNEIIKNQIVQAFIGLGEVIGGALSGAGFEDIFKGLLSIITDGMKAIGGAMIALGVAQLQFITGLSSLNPGVLIGGGVALIAAATAVQAAFSGLGSSLGGNSGGDSSSPSGNFTFDRSEQSLDINVTGSFNGSDIVLAYDTIKSRENRLKG